MQGWRGCPTSRARHDAHVQALCRASEGTLVDLQGDLAGAQLEAERPQQVYQRHLRPAALSKGGRSRSSLRASWRQAG